MPDNDLGPMPESTTQEPELIPGGSDAIVDDPANGGLGRDLSPDDNPAVDDALPEEIAQPDDKSQAPDEGSDADDDASGEGTDEPDAGQEAEDGSIEPPA